MPCDFLNRWSITACCLSMLNDQITGLAILVLPAYKSTNFFRKSQVCITEVYIFLECGLKVKYIPSKTDECYADSIGSLKFCSEEFRIDISKPFGSLMKVYPTTFIFVGVFKNIINHKFYHDSVVGG